MNTWPSFSLLLLSSLLAAKVSKAAVKIYFRAQFVATLMLFAGERWFGLSSDLYRIVYLMTLALLMETLVFVLWDMGIDDRVALPANILAFALGIVSIVALPKIGKDELILICEAMMDVIVGFSLL